MSNQVNLPPKQGESDKKLGDQRLRELYQKAWNNTAWVLVNVEAGSMPELEEPNKNTNSEQQ